MARASALVPGGAVGVAIALPEHQGEAHQTADPQCHGDEMDGLDSERQHTALDGSRTVGHQSATDHHGGREPKRQRAPPAIGAAPAREPAHTAATPRSRALR